MDLAAFNRDVNLHLQLHSEPSMNLVAMEFMLHINGKSETYQALGTTISRGRAFAEAVALAFVIWTVTLPIIIIPGLHLVGIPAGLFGGIAIPSVIYRRRACRVDIVMTSCSCPACATPLPLALTNVTREDNFGMCQGCGHPWTVPKIK
jgi:hypothetical protein